MSAPTGRDNGLPGAASYVALVDVDPPVADHVLAMLREAGIPAVAEPIAGEVGPYRDVRPPPSPTERVHVDRARGAEARELVGAALPALRGDFHADAALRVDRAQMQAAEVEQAFAAIVSGFDSPVAAAGPWPAAEDRDTDEPEEDDGDVLLAPGQDGPEEPHRGLSARLVRRAEDGDADPDPSYWPEDRFVPPVPPRPPRGDRATRFAWAGIIGGPLLLLVGVTFNLRLDRLVMYAAVGAFIAGFATLIARMPDHSDDDNDDGAVV